MARFQKYDETLADEILNFVTCGASAKGARKRAGLTAYEFYRWRTLPREPYRTFQRELRKAEGTAQIDAEMRLHREDPKCWVRFGPGRSRIKTAAAAKTQPLPPDEQPVLSRKDYLRLFNIVDEALGDNTEIRERVADELMKASKEQFKEAKHRRLQSMGLVSVAFMVAALGGAGICSRMTNNEFRMPKEYRSINDECQTPARSDSSLGIRYSFDIRHSEFVIPGPPLPPRLGPDDKRALESLFALVGLALDFDFPLEGCGAVLTTAFGQDFLHRERAADHRASALAGEGQLRGLVVPAFAPLGLEGDGFADEDVPVLPVVHPDALRELTDQHDSGAADLEHLGRVAALDQKDVHHLQGEVHIFSIDIQREFLRDLPFSSGLLAGIECFPAAERQRAQCENHQIRDQDEPHSGVHRQPPFT